MQEILNNLPHHINITSTPFIVCLLICGGYLVHSLCVHKQTPDLQHMLTLAFGCTGTYTGFMLWASLFNPEIKQLIVTQYLYPTFLLSGLAFVVMGIKGMQQAMCKLHKYEENNMRIRHVLVIMIILGMLSSVFFRSADADLDNEQLHFIAGKLHEEKYKTHSPVVRQGINDAIKSLDMAIKAEDMSSIESAVGDN